MFHSQILGEIQGCLLRSVRKDWKNQRVMDTHGENDPQRQLTTRYDSLMETLVIREAIGGPLYTCDGEVA